MSQTGSAFFIITLLLWGISFLCAVYRYIIRPSIYSGETVAEVVEIASINYGNARVIIEYDAEGEVWEKVITSGVKQFVAPGMDRTSLFYDVGDQLTIRYNRNSPTRLYVKRSKLTLSFILMLATLFAGFMFLIPALLA